MADPTWTKINVAQNPNVPAPPMPIGWYFVDLTVKATAPATAFLHWNGIQFAYNPATNTWSRVTATNNIGWRENYGSVHDVDNGVLRLGSGTSGPPEWAGAIKYTLGDSQYTTDAPTGLGSTAILCMDPSRHLLHTFAGFNASNRDHKTRVTSPLAGSWSSSTPTGMWPPLTQDGAKYSYLRGGCDQRTGTCWFLADNQELYLRNPTTGNWSHQATTGPKPPTYAVADILEASNALVAYVGRNNPTNDPPYDDRYQTYILNMTTWVWQLGPSGVANTPGGSVLARAVLRYDRVNSRLLFVHCNTGDATTDVYAMPSFTTPAPPTTFVVSVATAGNGHGTTTGAGAYAPGAAVVLTATPAADSTFTGWDGPPNFTMPSNDVTRTATFALKPDPPIPPPVDLDIPTRQFTAFPLPAITSNAAPFVDGGDTKDVNGFYDSIRRYLVLGTGDFTFVGANNSGNPSVFSWTGETNTWGTLSGMAHPTGQITPNHPSDRGAFIHDTLRDRYWNANAVPFPDQENQPTSGGSIYKSGLLYMDAKTKIWTQVAPKSFSSSIGGGAYDTAIDSLLVFEQGAGCVGNPGHLRVVPLSNPTGPNETYDLCLTPGPKYVTGQGGWVAPEHPERVFFAWDDVARNLYIVVRQIRYASNDSIAETRASFYKFSMTTRTWTALPPAPLKAGVTVESYFMMCVWDSVTQHVLYPVVTGNGGPAGIVAQMLAYDPQTNTWDDVPCPLTQLRGNCAFFHPGINAMLLAGSVFDPNGYKQHSLFLYRHDVPPPDPGDTVPPTCAITAPVEGAVVSGPTVAVTATAADDVGVTALDFLVDSILVATDTAAPYGFTLNSTTLVDGPHTIACRARDAAGNVTLSTTVVFQVKNTPPPSPDPPVVAIVEPEDEDTVSGSFAVQVTATHANGIASVTLVINGADQPGPLTSAPFNFTVDSTAFANGGMAIAARAVALANGGQATSPITFVNVSNSPPADTTVPTCAITNIVQGQTLSGVVSVAITASDNVGVKRVRLFLNNQPIGDDTAAPYAVPLDTTTKVNGSYNMSARAYDEADNEGVSEGILVTIFNTPPDTTPPDVTINSPIDGAQVSDTIVVVTATDAQGVVQVQLEVDGTIVAQVSQQPALLSLVQNLPLVTTGLDNGLHLLTARAQDISGNVGVDSIVIDVFNPVVVPGEGNDVRDITIKWRPIPTSTPNAINFTQYRVTLGNTAVLVPLTTLQYTFEDVADGFYTGKVELVTDDESQVAGIYTFTKNVHPPNAPLPTGVVVS